MGDASVAIQAPTQQEIVDWVCQATKEVFETMLGLEAEFQADYMEKAGEGTNEGPIGIIGLVGEWTGTAVVSCTAPLACTISSELFMAEYSSVTDEVLDAISEMTNMIIGNLKNSLENCLGQMGLSIPAVVFGRNFATRKSGGGQWYSIQFTVEGERFTVQVCLVPSQVSSGRMNHTNPRIMTLT
jgi:chemotaxis protein CheX